MRADGVGKVRLRFITGGVRVEARSRVVCVNGGTRKSSRVARSAMAALVFTGEPSDIADQRGNGGPAGVDVA